MRPWPVALSFAVIVATLIGIVAGSVNADQFALTAVLAGAIALVPLAIVGRAAYPARPADGRAAQEQERRSEAATARAWRDTVIGVGAVLVVVALIGVQWSTSWVLLGVLILAFCAQAVRHALAFRSSR